MRICKLKSDKEDEEINVIVSFAIIVHRTYMKDIIQLVKDIKIPAYLKRVKPVDDWMYVLVTSHNHKSLSKYDTIKINIPHKPAYTQDQYNQYKEIWPCVFYREKEEFIDHRYVKKWINYLINLEITEICSGCCIIVNGDSLLGSYTDKDNILGHSIFACVDFVSRSQFGYLCTGFDAFILNEPCLSCSMVFVHGRIKRVFCVKKKKMDHLAN